MGGFLSGWHGRRSYRPVLDELPRIHVKALPKDVTAPLLMTYREGTEHVALLQSPATLGGFRLWFECPRCLKRCMVLYFLNGFRCRQCTGSRYACQSETHGSRAVRRANKEVKRCRTDYTRRHGKPKWMRWRTYERLSTLAENAAEVIISDQEWLSATLLEVDSNVPRARRRVS